MNARLVHIATQDKLGLHGLLYIPDISTQKLILHIHGMGGNFYENHFLDFMSKTYTDNGYAFLSINTRGHELVADFALAVSDKEEYRRIGVVNEIFEECVIDIGAWMDFAEQEEFSEVFLQGHSLGCSKVAYYLAKTQDIRIKKLILLSPADMVGLTEKYIHFSEMMSEAQKLVSEDKETQILSQQLDDWYFMSAKTFLDYSLRGNPIDVFNTYDPEADSVLKEISTPMLALFGNGNDTYLTSPEEALEVVKMKSVSCPDFVSKIISGAPHSYKNHEQEVADAVMGFIKK